MRQNDEKMGSLLRIIEEVSLFKPLLNDERHSMAESMVEVQYVQGNFLNIAQMLLAGR